MCAARRPESVRAVAHQGACRVGAGVDVGKVDLQMAGMIDHTLLKADATAADVKKLCDEARKYCFASVCVNSTNVAKAAAYLEGAGVMVCAVVGFPLGAMTPTAKAFEAREAVRCGAAEIDMVINIGALEVARLCARRGRHPPRGAGGAAGQGQGDPGDRGAHDRREDHRLHAVEDRGGALRQDVDGVRSRRRDRRGHRAHAPSGRRRDGRQGVGRRAHARGRGEDARGRRRSHRRLGVGGDRRRRRRAQASQPRGTSGAKQQDRSRHLDRPRLVRLRRGARRQELRRRRQPTRSAT